MPNISVQLRRGTDTEHSSFTGAVGEVTVDTTNDTLRVHDGSTAGGIRLAKLSEAGGSGTVTSVDSGTGLTGGPITTSGTLSLASINNLNVLGNVSGSTAAPTSVEIKDEDAMTSDSATALATQQSIKAYVDTQIASSGGPSVFAKGFIDLSNNVSNSTNITSSSHSGNEFTVTFTTGGGTNHALKNVQVTPRVSTIGGPFSNYSIQYKWTSATVLVVSVQGMSAIDGISLIIFD